MNLFEYENNADEWIDSYINNLENKISNLEVENKKLKEDLKAVNKGLKKVLSKRKKWKDRYYKEKYKIKNLINYLENLKREYTPNLKVIEFNEDFDYISKIEHINAKIYTKQPIEIINDLLEKVNSSEWK